MSAIKSYVTPQSRMSFLPRYYHWQMNIIEPYINGDVLELGCGSGNLIGHYIHLADSVIAVDYDRELLDQVEMAYKNTRKVTVKKMDIMTEIDLLEHCRFDTVIACDILEHVQDEYYVLNEIYKLLKDDGTLILKVPAEKDLFCMIDLESGHYRRYDRVDLQFVAESVKLKVLFLRHLNSFGYLMYRIKRNHKGNFSTSFNHKLLKLANFFMPVLVAMDLIFKNKGLSLIGVFQK